MFASLRYDIRSSLLEVHLSKCSKSISAPCKQILVMHILGITSKSFVGGQ